MFSCMLCKRNFKAKRSLQRHVKIHENIRFKCSDCSKSFTRVHDRNRHTKEVHQQIEIVPSIFVPNIAAGSSNTGIYFFIIIKRNFNIIRKNINVTYIIYIFKISYNLKTKYQLLLQRS